MANYVNQTLALPIPRGKDECLKEYNALQKSAAEGKGDEKDGKPSVDEKKADDDENKPVDAEADADGWSVEEKKDLEKALKKFKGLEKNEKWNKIARFVATKSKRECVDKFKKIREEIKAK